MSVPWTNPHTYIHVVRTCKDRDPEMDTVERYVFTETSNISEIGPMGMTSFNLKTEI